MILLPKDAQVLDGFINIDTNSHFSSVMIQMWKWTVCCQLQNLSFTQQFKGSLEAQKNSF